MNEYLPCSANCSVALLALGLGVFTIGLNSSTMKDFFLMKLLELAADFNTWTKLFFIFGLYWVPHKLPQKYTANHATFPIQIHKITVQICGNFWGTQYDPVVGWWMGSFNPLFCLQRQMQINKNGTRNNRMCFTCLFINKFT